MMKITRRKFQASLVAIPVVFSGFAQFVFAAKKRGGGAAAPAADSKDVCKMELAKVKDYSSVNFATDKSTIKDAALKKEVSGVAWDKQTCANCVLFMNAKKCADGQLGQCAIVGNKAVHANSWCGSWIKKA